MGDQVPAETGSQKGFSWRKLLSFAAFGAALAITLATIFIFRSFDPPFVVMLVLFVTGGALALRPGKAGVAGTVLAALAALMFSGLGGPFVFFLLQAPRTTEVVPVVATFLLSLTVLISAIVLAIRGRGRAFEPSTAAKTLGTVVVISIAGVTAWNIYLLTSFDSQLAQPGDIRVVTADFEFRPKSFSADSGTVGVHVTNRDNTLHTFTIESLGVDIEVPPGKTARADFQAGPGEYRFVCKPHEPDMAGELRVT